MVSLQCEFSCVLQAFRFDQNSFHTEGMLRLLPSMNFHVPIENTFLSETYSTLLAGERFSPA